MKETQLQILVHDNVPSSKLIASEISTQHDQDQGICKHCGTEIPVFRKTTGFCCNGCKFVYQLINSENLERFYQLKSNTKLAPKILFFKRTQNLDWLDSVDTNKAAACEFTIEGIECTACVWLMKTLANRMDIPNMEINSVSGRIRISSKGLVKEKLKDFFTHLQDFGYRVFPAQKGSTENLEAKRLLFRIGIVAASVMNSMMFSFAMYLGLTNKEPFLFELFSHLNFLFCALAVGVGGSYFFRKAWAGLKMRMFHFDLPVSFGILAAFAGSSYSYFFGNQEHVYFDTLCTFIFLMLVGRFLQVRWVEKNRASISSMKELESMTVKRIGDSIQEITIDQIQSGDMLLIVPGGMVPVTSELKSPATIEISQEWITGESDPVEVPAGNSVSAGSHNISLQPMYVRATENYRSGDLCNWVFSSQGKSPTTSFWQTYAQKYTLMVLSLLGFGFLYFAFTDLERAIKTAVTISLVTCPCGIGIGIPMAQMVAQRKLLAMGIYLRDLNLLEHLKKIKTLVFDKTGTLTLAELRITNPQDLKNLQDNELSILFHAASQSQHPVSQAIYHHLMTFGLPWKKIDLREVPGQGLEIEADGLRYFLGKKPSVGDGLVFMNQDQVLLKLEFEETLLEDARPVFQELQKTYNVQILSGDKLEKVSKIASRLGLGEKQCLAQCTPQQKEEWIQNHHPEQAFFLGDGLNDSLALRKALISGVSLSSSLSLASNANFYFSTLNIRWLPKMLSLGNRFSSVVKWNVIFSIVYNCVAVVLAMIGVLSPLGAAIVMPAVSLVVVGVSSYSMKKVKAA
jgi:Cu2+-exporting ATPase